MPGISPSGSVNQATCPGDRSSLATAPVQQPGTSLQLTCQSPKLTKASQHAATSDYAINAWLHAFENDAEEVHSSSVREVGLDP